MFTLRIIRNTQIQNAASLTGEVDGTSSYLSALKGKPFQARSPLHNIYNSSPHLK
jgi:hypothetical protein